MIYKVLLKLDNGGTFENHYLCLKFIEGRRRQKSHVKDATLGE